MENEIRIKIERWKIKAEDFLKNNIKAFIVDTNNTWYSCEIVLVGDVSLLIKNFEGDNIDIKQKIYWADVIRFEEYNKKEEWI